MPTPSHIKCKTCYQVPCASIHLRGGEVGIIDDVSLDETLVNITVRSRTPSVCLQVIPLTNLKVGLCYVADTQPLPLVLTGPLFTTIRPSPPGSSSYSHDDHPVRMAVATFLSGVWDHRGRITYLSRHHNGLLKDDDNIKQSITRFRDSVQRVNQQFFRTISAQNFALDGGTQPLLRRA